MTVLILLAALAALGLAVAVIRLAPAYLGAWAAVAAREKEIAAADGADPPRRAGRAPAAGAGHGLGFWTGCGARAASAEGPSLPAGMTVEWIVGPSPDTAGHGIALTSTGAFAHLDPGTAGGAPRWTLATSVEALAGTAPGELLGMALHRVGPVRRFGTGWDGDGRGPRPTRDILAV